MLERLSADKIYPDRPFLRDFLTRQGKAPRFLENASRGTSRVPGRAARITRDDALLAALRRSNLAFGAGDATLANVDALSSPTTMCIQTGQQPGILGGPLFTAYKILTAIHTARDWADRLGVPVVPIYWLASQDHDLSEVNSLHWLNNDGTVASAAFRGSEEGRRLDALPLSNDVLRLSSQYFRGIADRGAHHDPDSISRLFASVDSDTFCSWHARIQLRLYGDYGLVIVDPCALPPPVPFYRTALEEAKEIRHRVLEQCRNLEQAGYPAPFTSAQAGGLFVQDPSDRRVRITDPGQAYPGLATHPSGFSPDAALRPLLADWLFPTAIHVLGPGEIAYHSALRTLYPVFGLDQPPALFRLSLSVLAQEDRSLIRDMGIPIEAAVSQGIRIQDAGWHLAPGSLRTAWERHRNSIDASLEALSEEAREIDPGLERSVGTTRGSVAHALERLESRMLRAVLARHGVPPVSLSRLTSLLRPKDRPQERMLALPELLVRHGPALIDRMMNLEPWPVDCHAVMTVDEEA